jgi:prevent-host-death family protein
MAGSPALAMMKFCAAAGQADRRLLPGTPSWAYDRDGHHGQGCSAMAAQVSIADAKARFAALIARAEAGERIVVTRNGRPVACLAPLPAQPPVKYGDLRGLRFAEDLSLPKSVIDRFNRPR